MRTNIVIDDKLMNLAMQLTGLKTKKAIVEEALRTLIQHKQQERILTLHGKVEWEGDLDEMRMGRFVDANHH